MSAEIVGITHQTIGAIVTLFGTIFTLMLAFWFAIKNIYE